MNHQHIPSAAERAGYGQSREQYLQEEVADLRARIVELEERNAALEEKCTLFAASLNKADDRIAELEAAALAAQPVKAEGELPPLPWECTEFGFDMCAWIEARSDAEISEAFKAYARAALAAVQPVVPQERQQPFRYLVTGWGETDYPEIILADTVEQVQTALVKLQFDNADASESEREQALLGFDADTELPWDFHFEIGGVEVKKVFISGELRTATTAPDAAAVRDGLHDAVIRACTVMPEGCLVRIEAEKGSGTVEWEDADGNTHQIDGEGYISDDVNEAIDRALAASPADVRAMGEQDA